MAGVQGSLQVYSNDGQTLLYSSNEISLNDTIFVITQTGFTDDGVATSINYGMQISGWSNTQGATVPDYTVNTQYIDVDVISPTGGSTVYIVPVQENKFVTTEGLNVLVNKIKSKQNTLTFDSTPTSSSTNPVTSGGVYTALSGKQNTLTFDSTPTQNSTNPVTSGGVHTALAGKQDTLTAGENITITNNVISATGGGGAIQTKYHLVKPNFSSTWSAKTWTSLTSFSGQNVWTDGINIYYSGGSGSSQYVLDVSTSTWSTKTWSGYTGILGNGVWTDGTNIYFSYNAAFFSNQYVLDVSTSTWSTKTWSGLTNFAGQNVWTDGTNIYFSGGQGTTQYVLDVATSTWSAKTWNGLKNVTGNNVWTDGDNIYYSSGTNQYVLDVSTSTWNAKTWTSLTSFSGQNVWTDGTNIYYSNSTDQYVLGPIISTKTKLK